MVLVRPDAADIGLEKDAEVVVEREAQPPEPIERFLSRRDDIGEPVEPVIEALWPSVGTRSFRERPMEVGDEVYVFGEVNKRMGKAFGEITVEIARGAEGGHPKPRTFVFSDQPKEAVSGDHGPGGRLAVVIGVEQLSCWARR